MFIWAAVAALGLGRSACAAAESEIEITKYTDPLGFFKPIPVHVSGFAPEVDAVLKQDLLFMGVEHVAIDQAQYVVNRLNGSGVAGELVAKVTKQRLLGRDYTGGTTRGQTHAFADDIAQRLTGLPGIAQKKIVFKAETSGGNSEIYVADYDAANARAVTQDGTIVAAPCWAGRSALFYTSYKLQSPQIFFHQLTTGERRPVARYSGLNTSAAVSPDGKKLAMILSKAGSPDLYVSDVDGGNLRQLTATREAESSPCWSPDGQTLCYVSRETGTARLYTVPASGGKPRHLVTAGAPNPTEPDWSPDGKWIAFTSQTRDFNICLVRAEGGSALVLAAGEDPTWAANSRAVVFCRGRDHAKSLCLLDVPSRHVKTLPRILGSNSQPCWAKY
jgi:TolB protein